jgi:hypothetical protein
MKKLIFVVVALLLGANMAAAAGPDGFDGVWEGVGIQDNNSSWSIKVTISSGRYTIDYPSLSCGGELTLLQESSGNIEFREKITYGINACITGGTTILTKVGKTGAEYQWFYPNGNKGATGTLMRK